jgi:hypothetical protein
LVVVAGILGGNEGDLLDEMKAERYTCWFLPVVGKLATLYLVAVYRMVAAESALVPTRSSISILLLASNNLAI